MPARDLLTLDVDVAIAVFPDDGPVKYVLVPRA